MKIFVLGGEGMLGHKMFQILSSHFPHTKCTIFGSLEDPFYRSIPLFTSQNTFEKINVIESAALERFLQKEKPDFTINCIGIVKQRDEGKMAIPSITINSLLPHLLADWASTWGGRLIHFSSDCVFSGKKGKYSEDDISDAEDLYGKSKYLGEVASANALTLRTSIIGRELNNFKSLLEWFLSQKGNRVKGYKKVVYSGVTTNYIAEIVGMLISDHPQLHGMYQVTAPAITKLDLLTRICAAYKLDIEIIPEDSEISDRSMIGKRFYEATGYKEPTWDYLIGQLSEDKTPYEQWKKEPQHV
jgi:dTDP-4-dehydrorhamnose reductase